MLHEQNLYLPNITLFCLVCVFLLVFSGSFSASRLYRAIGIRKILCRVRGNA